MVPKMMEVTPANLSRLLLSLRKTMPTTESAAMTTADHTAYATEVSCVVKGGDISGCGASSTRGSGWAPSGLASSWERRTQSPEEAQEPS